MTTRRQFIQAALGLPITSKLSSSGVVESHDIAPPDNRIYALNRKDHTYSYIGDGELTRELPPPANWAPGSGIIIRKAKS